VDFSYSARVEELRSELLDFMHQYVYPAEAVFREQVESGRPHQSPPVMEELKAEARRRGLWNLFLPDPRWGAGLTNLEYAPSPRSPAQLRDRSRALNCQAPDTGNMELLAQFGTPSSRSAGCSRCSTAPSAPASR